MQTKLNKKRNSKENVNKTKQTPTKKNTVYQ